MAESQCEIENRKLEKHFIKNIEYNRECQRKEKLKKNEELVELLDKCPDFECDNLKQIQDDDCKKYCQETHKTNEGACFHQSNSKSDFCLCGNKELAQNKGLRAEMEIRYLGTEEGKSRRTCDLTLTSIEERENNCVDRCFDEERTLMASCGINSLYWGLINELEIYNNQVTPVCYCPGPNILTQGRLQCLEIELNRLSLIINYFIDENCDGLRVSNPNVYCDDHCKQKFYPSSRVYGKCDENWNRNRNRDWNRRCNCTLNFI